MTEGKATEAQHPVQPLGTGDSREKPIKLGGALFTLVEPHRGREVAYNRWYERDHFYAGCMIGAWNFAGARFVATRACKEKRYPLDSPITPDPTVGSFLSIYWILAGRFGDWLRWGTDQVIWLHENQRMFSDREHIHTLMYKFLAEQPGRDDAVPIELALDHRFSGLVAVIGQPAAGQSSDDVVEWSRAHPLPAEVMVTFTPIPLLGDAPSDVPRDENADRFLQLYFLDGDPLAVWDDVFAPLGAAMESEGVGKILFASPFIPTVPGTDTYTDQLW